YNNNISLREEQILGIVRKTVQNLSYWEKYSENNSLYSINENNLVLEEELFIPQTFYRGPYFLKEIISWDLRTGWMISRSIKAYNAGETYYEVSLELLERNSNFIFNLPVNCVFGLFLLGCISFFYFISKTYQLKLTKKKL
ncbi:MAG: hypothetical protein ACXACU_01620, partial [Candidatus Hodarchaeales archaeon]